VESKAYTFRGGNWKFKSGAEDNRQHAEVAAYGAMDRSSAS
jgi:hypothetical protein